MSAGNPIEEKFALTPAIRAHAAWFAAISLAVLAPCFWQKHIEAGDLGSHVYDAWLAQLIRNGQAPGLYLATQWNNSLFDTILQIFCRWFGFAAGERIAVCAAVLIFFWGAASFACAAARRVPWSVLPAIAMVSYGFIFHSGFFNFYLATGISFWALSIFLGLRDAKRYLAFGLAPLIYFAHPVGFAWGFGALVYCALVERIPGWARASLPLLPAAFFTFLHFYLPTHYPVNGPTTPRYLANGADQLALSEDRHMYVAAAAFVLGLAACCVEAYARREEWRTPGRTGLLLQLYAATQMAVLLLPGVVVLPNFAAPVSFLTERFSLLSAVLGCGLLARVRPRAWHAAGFAAIAAAFFLFTYRETALLDRMESQAEQLVRNLPQGQRVLETIDSRPGSRLWFANHMVDRACIGYCFAYANYEPSSGQFRVRARPGNSIVMTSLEDTGDAEEGNYVVRPRDLPVWQIEPCREDMARLCIRPLAAGERNGSPHVRHGEESE